MIRISREQIKALSNCTTKMRKTKESSADLEGESKLALIEATSTTQMWKTLSKVEEIYNQHMPTSKPMIAGVV